MRGKGTESRKPEFSDGITPAHAGKSIPHHPPTPAWWDHPRICGEKALSTFSSLKNSGSPPRVRGKDQHKCNRCGDKGITPAYAGKSGRTFRAVRSSWDHPRVCGEKSFTLALVEPVVGSPPHMRGKACASSRRACAARITPAHAGKRVSSG